MALRLTLPMGKDDNVKNLVFSILTKEYPLKIVELTNLIRKRYGKSVTFQAVRKAILELTQEGVLVKGDREFSINKKWVYETKKTLDLIYFDLTKEQKSPKTIDSIEGEISVFTFESVADMMKFWEDIVDDWFENYKKDDLNINAWQGAHIWETLIYPERESKIIGQLKKKGIKSYAVNTGNTPLDKYILKFYHKIGAKFVISPSNSSFDRTYYVATYGKTIVQVHYPPQIVEAFEKFFKNTKTIEDLDLHELAEIVNRKEKVKLTVIKNRDMALQINKSILSQIE